MEKPLVRLFKDCYHHRSFGDSWGYGYLAEGKLDIIAEPYINIWDIAAQVVIVREAGGKVTGANPGLYIQRQCTLLAIAYKVYYSVFWV